MSRPFKIFLFVLAGAILGPASGYIIGALIGLVMTYTNNEMMVGTPQGSYPWWANFMGILIAMFAFPVGLILGLVFGLVQPSGARGKGTG